MASACGSLPLLCPETWLPSALPGDSERDRQTAEGQGPCTCERVTPPPAALMRLCFLPPVVFLVNQVVTSAEGHQVGVVGRCRDGDGARAAHVGVAQLVGEELELITAEAVVVPQNVIVGRSARSLWGDQHR